MDKARVKNVSKIIGKTVLATLAVGGVVALVCVAPGLPFAVAPFVKKDKYRQNENFYKKYSRQIIKRLAKRGMVKILERNGETMLAITKLGKEQLRKWELGKLNIEKPKRWDGKWRVAIFDIPEKRRRIRNVVRQQLKDLGFHCLQNSVWVHPYKCEEIILSIAKEYNLLPYIMYMETNYLGRDKYLREIFNV
jgi:DNA-binding transcriptional regulator PaaX